MYATSTSGSIESTNNHQEASHKKRHQKLGSHIRLYEFMIKSGTSYSTATFSIHTHPCPPLTPSCFSVSFADEYLKDEIVVLDGVREGTIARGRRTNKLEHKKRRIDRLRKLVDEGELTGKEFVLTVAKLMANGTIYTADEEEHISPEVIDLTEEEEDLPVNAYAAWMGVGDRLEDGQGPQTAYDGPSFFDPDFTFWIVLQRFKEFKGVSGPDNTLYWHDVLYEPNDSHTESSKAMVRTFLSRFSDIGDRDLLKQLKLSLTESGDRTIDVHGVYSQVSTVSPCRPYPTSEIQGRETSIN